MNPERLEKLFSDDNPPLVLDVRSGSEYQSGHIPGAVHAPMGSINPEVKKLMSEDDRLIVLVCEHGPRAQLARFLLKLRGYKNMELLEGHMTLWRRSGRVMRTE